MDKFLEMYNPPRLHQEEIQTIARTITSHVIESVIKQLPKNKSPGLNGSTGEFYQTCRES